MNLTPPPLPPSLPSPPGLARRAFLGALVLARLVPTWPHRGPFEPVAQARARVALCPLDSADTHLRRADTPSPLLGVPASNANLDVPC